MFLQFVCSWPFLSPKSTMLTSMGGIQVVLFENVVLEFGILVSSRCTTSLESCATKFFITSRCTDAILHERGIADFLRKSISASSVGLDVVVAASKPDILTKSELSSHQISIHGSCGLPG